MTSQNTTHRFSGLLSAIATLGPIGYLPAPGTAGSLVAAILGVFITIYFGIMTLVVMIVIAALVSFPAIDAHHALTGKHDNKEIIIDEVVGQWLVFLAIPLTPLWGWNYLLLVGLAFILFRVFDILKPPPVSTAEELPGAAGVIADDVMAGVLAGVLIMGGMQLMNAYISS
ncbi:MAG: phosphatidylglycerophosphatase A [Proteobacteria bacterium]|jgi:phosphatidylglycerophosphatase A|nr:phosphatidylglycerophosphatase A [Alphaproteobacteria bacterium]MDA0909312.1 phosphatidylglycerophosphatase A [Pseudomonadota bacterium]